MKTVFLLQIRKFISNFTACERWVVSTLYLVIPSVSVLSCLETSTTSITGIINNWTPVSLSYISTIYTSWAQVRCLLSVMGSRRPQDNNNPLVPALFLYITVSCRNSGSQTKQHPKDEGLMELFCHFCDQDFRYRSMQPFASVTDYQAYKQDAAFCSLFKTGKMQLFAALFFCIKNWLIKIR